MDSLEKIGFGGGGVRSCSFTGESIIQYCRFLNPYRHNSEGTDGQGKFLFFFFFFNVFKEMGNVGDLSECLIDRCQGRGAGLALSVGQRS